MNALLVAALGSLILALLAYPLFRYKTRIKASENFLNSFEQEMLVLRNEGDITVYETLRNSFDRHQLAVNEFKRYLKGRKFSAFNDAWHEYHHNPNGKRLQQYMSTSNYEETKKRRLLALQRLEAVLAFASN